MALPSSHTSQVAGSPRPPLVLGPLSVRKRRHDSSSSESSSGTVKAVSRRKTLGKRPAGQNLREKKQDKREKKRSRLPGLTNRFYVGPQSAPRTTQPSSGATSRINIEEGRSLDIGASNTATKEIMSSSDSEACCFVVFYVDCLIISQG